MVVDEMDDYEIDAADVIHMNEEESDDLGCESDVQNLGESQVEELVDGSMQAKEGGAGLELEEEAVNLALDETSVEVYVLGLMGNVWGN